MAENVIEIDQSNFDSTVKANPKLVVDCWAEWCGPCRMMGPIIDRLAKEHAGKYAFAKLNVDESPQLSQAHRIMAIPTLLFFKDGQVVDQIVGLVPKEEIEEVMRKKL
ncbi:MAG: thioredoxin [Methanomassiliicoccus sp.]|nr:thioredoxin [Methanomassiliicoccus sp.]